MSTILHKSQWFKYSMHISHCKQNVCIESLNPSYAFLGHWTGSSLIREMDCCLLDTKPSPEPKRTCLLETNLIEI